MLSRYFNDRYNTTVNYSSNQMQYDNFFYNDPYNQNNPYLQPDPFNHLDPYLTVKDPYLQNNNFNNNSSYYDNNCNRVVFWRDDVITLTGHLIKTVESLIKVPGLVLTEFHRGNSLYQLLFLGEKLKQISKFHFGLIITFNCCQL